jgi:hypothetical protein
VDVPQRANDIVIYEHGNEQLCFMQGDEFVDQLSGYHVLKKDSVLWI